MAKKMSEMESKSPGILDRLRGWFSSEPSIEDLRGAQGQYEARKQSELENLRQAEADYAQKQKAQLEEMRAAQGEYQAKQTEQAPEYFTQVTDKFMKDPITGKTKYGANNAPILNPNYDENAYNEMLAQRQKEANAPGFMERIAGGVSSFTKENPNLTSGLIQGAAGVGGYLATRGSLKEQEELAKRQLASAGRIGERLGQITATPQFTQQETELQRILAGGGITPEEQLMSKMGLRKAGAGALSLMKAGEERAKQRGQVTGGGERAAALIAAQGGANRISDTESAIRSSAESRRDKAAEQLSNLEQRKFTNIQGLAQAQDVMASSRAAQEAAALGVQRGIEAGRGEATGRLISTGANVITGAIDKNKIEAAKKLGESGGTQVSSSEPQTESKITGANIAPFNQTNLNPAQKIVSTAANIASPIVNKLPDNLKKQAASTLQKAASGAGSSVLKSAGKLFGI